MARFLAGLNEEITFNVELMLYSDLASMAHTAEKVERQLKVRTSVPSFRSNPSNFSKVQPRTSFRPPQSQSYGFQGKTTTCFPKHPATNNAPAVDKGKAKVEDQGSKIEAKPTSSTKLK